MLIPLRSAAEVPAVQMIICRVAERAVMRGVNMERLERRIERRFGFTCNLKERFAESIERTKWEGEVLPRPGGVFVELINVQNVFSRLGIDDDEWSLRSFTADKTGENVAFLLNHPREGFRVFKNGDLLLQGPNQIFEDPVPFRMTEDGHLLIAIEGSTLYLDGKKLTGEGNSYDFSKGQDTAVYDGEGVAYPEEASVQYENIETGEKQSYEHPGVEVQKIKKSGSDIFYSVRDGGAYYLYKNGEQFSDIPIANPWGFHITRSGDVYFFVEDDENYGVFKNSRLVLSKPGKAAFMVEDTLGNIWHAGFTQVLRTVNGVTFNANSMTLYRNDERMTDADTANMEFSIAFFGDHFSLRAAPADQKQVYFSWPPEWRLLKNGAFVGESFTFSQLHRDSSGVRFALNGRTYMKNFDEDRGRWCIYEDGRKIFPNAFANIFFLRVDGDAIRVYGWR